MKNKIYVGLVHHPVHNKFNEIVTTSITNLDIHDISRSCITFGVEKFLCINRLESQRDLFDRIINFWKTSIAKEYNSDRVEALELIRFHESIKTALDFIKNQEGIDPIIITTSAIENKNKKISFFDLKKKRNFDKPIFLIFGTGNGLATSVHEMADYVLEPIHGVGKYNHLSVRSAVAIVLDRLSSEEYKEE